MTLRDSQPFSRRALAIFCRAPQRGEVKTRLARDFGDDFALDFYCAMLRDSFALGAALRGFATVFAYFTAENALLQTFWSGPELAQPAGDLGHKIRFCFEELRARGFAQIAVIGSDSPDLPPDFLRAAFEAVQTPHALALGAAHDGGFWGLAANGALPKPIFEGVSWGGSEVAAQIRRNLATQNIALRELAAWRDVDDADDLRALQARLLAPHASPEIAPHTREFLAKFHAISSESMAA